MLIKDNTLKVWQKVLVEKAQCMEFHSEQASNGLEFRSRYRQVNLVRL
jgi:hypothetical protein